MSKPPKKKKSQKTQVSVRNQADPSPYWGGHDYGYVYPEVVIQNNPVKEGVYRGQKNAAEVLKEIGYNLPVVGDVLDAVDVVDALSKGEYASAAATAALALAPVGVPKVAKEALAKTLKNAPGSLLKNLKNGFDFTGMTAQEALDAVPPRSADSRKFIKAVDIPSAAEFASPNLAGTHAASLSAVGDQIETARRARLAEATSPEGIRRLTVQENELLSRNGVPPGSTLDALAQRNVLTRLQHLLRFQNVNANLKGKSSTEALNIIDNNQGLLRNNAFAVNGATPFESSIGIGMPYLSDPRVPTQHEIMHILGGGGRGEMPRDLRLKQALTFDPTVKNSQVKNAFDYFQQGNEPTAYLGEYRELLKQHGFIKNNYDDITEDILLKAHDYFRNTPVSSVVKSIDDPMYTMHMSSRVPGFMNPTPEGIAALVKEYKDLPAVVGAAALSAPAIKQLMEGEEGYEYGGAVEKSCTECERAAQYESGSEVVMEPVDTQLESEFPNLETLVALSSENKDPIPKGTPATSMSNLARFKDFEKFIVTPETSHSYYMRNYTRHNSLASEGGAKADMYSAPNCLAGALNCESEFVAGQLGLPNTRSKQEAAYPNPAAWEGQLTVMGNDPKQGYNSIDAWEFADAAVKGGYAIEIPFTSEEDLNNLPLGTFILGGERDFLDKDGKIVKAPNHAMLVNAFNKEGKTLMYDYGEQSYAAYEPGRTSEWLPSTQERMYSRTDPGVRIIVPKQYQEYTFENFKKMNAEYNKALAYDKGPIKNKFDISNPHMRLSLNTMSDIAPVLGKEYDIPSSTMSKLMTRVIGIGSQETDFGGKGNREVTVIPGKDDPNSISMWNAAKEMIMDTPVLNRVVPNIAKEVKALKSSASPNQKSDWELEIAAYREANGDPEKMETIYKRLRETFPKKGPSDVDTDFLLGSDNISKGIFKIKKITDFARDRFGLDESDLWGSNVLMEDEVKNGSTAALAYIAESYNKLQKKYPDLTEDQLVDLATISFNSHDKWNSKEFVDFYIRGKKLPDAYLKRVQHYESKNVKPHETPKFKFGGMVLPDKGPKNLQSTMDPEEELFASALEARTPYVDERMGRIIRSAKTDDERYMRIEDAMTNDYNTDLTPIEKIHFAKWIEAGFGNPRDIGTYDIQGYWKSKEWKNNTDIDNHGSDTYKKPNHPTFSDESRYSAQKGGSGYIAGQWREDGGFMAGPHNFYDNDYLRWTFSHEPDRPEYLYTGLPAVTIEEKEN